MIGNIRTLMTLLIVCFLFMAYTPTDSGMGNPILSTSMVRPLASLTRQLSLAGINGCPGQLNTCQTPQSLRLAYGIDPLIQQGFTGKGQTVIDIVSFGSPTLQQDMDVFDQTFNLPPIKLQVISPLNIPKQGSLQDQTGWAQETELDVQIIHALAPGANIIVLQSPVSETQGIVGLPEYRQLEQYVISHRLGNIVSQSWGASELTLQDAQGLEELQKWDALLRQGTVTNHITYFSSSGDNGAADAVNALNKLGNVPTTSFAPDSPWVTSVGGTRLQSRGSTFIETAWSDHGDSAGSGGVEVCGGARELLVRLGDIGVGVCLVLDGGTNGARVLRVQVVFLVVLPVGPVLVVVVILERLVVVQSIGDSLSRRSCLVRARSLAARLQTAKSTKSSKPTKGAELRSSCGQSREGQNQGLVDHDA